MTPVLTCCCCRVSVCAQGVIAAAELLAPAYLVEGEDSPDEAEEYVEVDNINPAQYYKVC